MPIHPRFLTFWATLNEECRERGMPEPSLRPARRAFDAALNIIRADVRGSFRTA